MMNNKNYENIPKELFTFAQKGEHIHDKKLETKPIGYFKDAWIRFRKNKSSVVAAVIIIVQLIFALVVPLFSDYDVTFRNGYYAYLPPKLIALEGTGFWDGTQMLNNRIQAEYDRYEAIGLEYGECAVAGEVTTTADADGNTLYNFRVDTYEAVGFIYVSMTEAEYLALQEYQNETGIQVIYPMPKNHKTNFVVDNGKANLWYELKSDNEYSNGQAKRDKEGNLVANYLTKDNPNYANYDSLRIEGDDGGKNGDDWYAYAVKNQTGYKVRVLYKEYFNYQNGFYANFVFGTNGYGQDILVCLAIGARLSFMLAIFVSAINLTIGTIYGSIEGYYGGAVDMTMERISDILASVPFIVVATLFQLHFAEKAGVIPSLLFAFVLTGWVGMASRVRMQFYRFKSQEYILASRTLGAKDMRLMFKHILPNAIGTIITGSVLSIPGVIFSESMLSYLGIVNLATSGWTSIGTMLSQGQGTLSTYPHIIMFPAIFIALLMVSFNLFGNGLRDAFNPSLRGVED